MASSTSNHKNEYKLLSENEKKQRGLRVCDFMKRMQKRLSKVRGTDNDKNAFFMRHNYDAYAHSQA